MSSGTVTHRRAAGGGPKTAGFRLWFDTSRKPAGGLTDAGICPDHQSGRFHRGQQRAGDRTAPIHDVGEQVDHLEHCTIATSASRRTVAPDAAQRDITCFALMKRRTKNEPRFRRA